MANDEEELSVSATVSGLGWPETGHTADAADSSDGTAGAHLGWPDDAGPAV